MCLLCDLGSVNRINCSNPGLRPTFSSISFSGIVQYSSGAFVLCFVYCFGFIWFLFQSLIMGIMLLLGQCRLEVPHWYTHIWNHNWTFLHSLCFCICFVHCFGFIDYISKLNANHAFSLTTLLWSNAPKYPQLKPHATHKMDRIHQKHTSLLKVLFCFPSVSFPVPPARAPHIFPTKIHHKNNLAPIQLIVEESNCGFCPFLA